MIKVNPVLDPEVIIIENAGYSTEELVRNLGEKSIEEMRKHGLVCIGGKYFGFNILAALKGLCNARFVRRSAEAGKEVIREGQRHHKDSSWMGHTYALTGRSVETALDGFKRKKAPREDSSNESRGSHRNGS